MKKSGILLIALATFTATVFSQTTKLSYAVHSLKNGMDNPMSYCSYTDPGSSGANISWDFSQLVFQQPFTGYLKNTMYSANQSSFPKANTELTEFDAHFYFDVNQKGIEQYGYSSADGRSKMIYQTPIVKIKYPFAYGDSYSGTFNGSFTNEGLTTGDILGTFTVEGDAYGTLILPGNSRFENTLRVIDKKEYTITFASSSQDVEIVTCRWYNAYHRYPILVLTQYTTKSGDIVSTNYQAAYNTDAVKTLPKAAELLFAVDDAMLYPNPVTTSMLLRLNSLNEGVLKMNIYDAAGKYIKSFSRTMEAAGNYEFDLSSEISDLKPAMYMLILENGVENTKLSFTLTEQ